MKIIEVAQFGGPEVLHMVEEPDLRPGMGEIVLDVRACGINFADVMARGGNYPGVPSAPFRPGWEVAGVVAARGEGVDRFAIGERVMGLIPSGGYASGAVLKAADAISLPDSLDFGQATALLIQGLTAYFLLETGLLRPGGSVLIPGAAGGVGSLAVQIARLKGASQVIGLASPSKHDLVRSLGADAVFDYTQAGWSKQVLAETNGEGIDIFLDSQGDLAGEGFDALGPKSHWLVFGSQAGSGRSLAPDRMWAMVGKCIALHGFNVTGSSVEFGRALPELLGWAASGKLHISVERFPLAEVARAHEAISQRKTTGKVVLEP